MEKYRTFNICQYENNPVTNESLNFSEENILSAVSHKVIKQYAYICHDRDVYTSEEEASRHGKKVGDFKNKHWHIVLKIPDSPQKISTVALWFGIPENYVQIPKGRGCFMDCVVYLTHESATEQAKGKVLYKRADIKHNIENLDEKMDNRINHLDGGLDELDIDGLALKVQEEGLNLFHAKEQYPLLFNKYFSRLKQSRLNYLYFQRPPLLRTNFFISGKAGVGKTSAAVALARSLYPNITDDKDLFFMLNTKNVTFEGYDGQPVIIYDDFRVEKMFEVFGDTGNICRIFDTSPRDRTFVNVKYGVLNLINTVNIITSVESYNYFLDGICVNRKTNEQEDPAQAYRRFPFIIEIHMEDYDLLINSKFIGISDDFRCYQTHRNFVSNVRLLHQKLSDAEQIAMYERKMIAPVIPIIEDANSKMQALSPEPLTDEELAYFESFGTQRPEKKYQFLYDSYEELLRNGVNQAPCEFLGSLEPSVSVSIFTNEEFAPFLELYDKYVR